MNQPANALPPELEIRVGGLVPMSAADFPGQLAAVVFLQGCPWRCRYCHNPHLIPATAPTGMGWNEIRVFLARRRKQLDAVVFTGGEPAFQRDLPKAMAETKGMGFKTGLHTGGGYPSRLEALLPHCDWVGMDIKAPFGRYERITGVPGSGEKALESARRLVESGVDYEFRTTVHPRLLGGNELLEMAQELAGLGAKNYVLQEFRARGCSDAELCNDVAESPVTDDALLLQLRSVLPNVSVRRA